jgi:hypothetical protein
MLWALDCAKNSAPPSRFVDEFAGTAHAARWEEVPMKLAYPIVLAATLAACTHPMHDDDTDLLGNDISSLRSETNRHHSQVMAASSLDEARTDVARHDSNVDDVMGRMSSHMNGMSGCMSGGMSMMHEKMGAITTEMADHGTAMQTATDMESVRGACIQHTAAMNDMLDGMGEALDSMGCM